MKVTYVDTSILAGILLGENASTKWESHLNARDELVSSTLLEAELLSLAVRDKISIHEAEVLLDFISLIQPDRSLRKEYHRILSIGYTKGADAHHLACALYLDPNTSEIEFYSADKNQRAIAKRLGFRTPTV